MTEPSAEGAGAKQARLDLDEAARGLLAMEVEELLKRIRDEDSRSRFAALRQAVVEGSVPERALPALEQLLTLGIETGRFERVHGRAAEMLARSLFQRTPAGRARAEQAEAVNRALAALAGTTLQALAFFADGPGAYRLRIETARGEVLVRIDRSGLQVDSVGVGA